MASAVVNDGTWLLYKGVRTKKDYFYFKISEVQLLANRAKNLNERDACEELNREKIMLFGKLTRSLLHLYRNFASHLIKTLHE